MSSIINFGELWAHVKRRASTYIMIGLLWGIYDELAGIWADVVTIGKFYIRHSSAIS